MKESEQQLRRDSVQQLFKGYYFNKNDMAVQQPEPAHNQSSQILLSGLTTTKTTQGLESEPQQNQLLGYSQKISRR